jgi:hypothetical protein
MADTKKEVKVKKTDSLLQDVPVKDKDSDKYDIKISKDQNIKFSEEIGHDKVSSDKLEVKVTKKGESNAKEKDGKIKIRCIKGPFRERFYLDGELELNEGGKLTLDADKLKGSRLNTDRHSYG